MSMSDLMTWFESEYISGCQGYYARMNPDLWMLTMEGLVRDMNAEPGFEKKKIVGEKYRKEFARLISGYLKSGPSIHLGGPWEAFYGSTHGLEGASCKLRFCIECGISKPPLKIVTDKKSKLPYMICKVCA